MTWGRGDANYASCDLMAKRQVREELTTVLDHVLELASEKLSWSGGWTSERGRRSSQGDAPSDQDGDEGHARGASERHHELFGFLVN